MNDRLLTDLKNKNRNMGVDIVFNSYFYIYTKPDLISAFSQGLNKTKTKQNKNKKIKESVCVVF